MTNQDRQFLPTYNWQSTQAEVAQLSEVDFIQQLRARSKSRRLLADDPTVSDGKRKAEMLNAAFFWEAANRLLALKESQKKT